MRRELKGWGKLLCRSNTVNILGVVSISVDYVTVGSTGNVVKCLDSVNELGPHSRLNTQK